ncbi:MAG: FKBP-type peptidyl-prolyl cis-trans isomerase [Phycisphaera sp.]|nr:FKBP-type peptidyl-prolyl cis-trans isomerase [Phycisphaera sp.]
MKALFTSFFCLMMILTMCSMALAEDTAQQPAAEQAPAQADTAQTDAAQPAPAPNADFPTAKEKVSYAIGLNIGMNMAQQGMTGLDADAIAKGIKDMLAGGKPRLSPEDIQAAMLDYQTQMQQEMAAQGEANKQKGQAFLAENGKREGVKTTATGLQYEVIKEGEGPMPKPTDTVRVNYRGTLVNGEEFDSSYARGEPIEFPVGGVIAGWSEALQLMKVGSKYKLYIPSDLAYGAQQRGPKITPNSTLVFEVELLDILPPEKQADQALEQKQDTAQDAGK